MKPGFLSCLFPLTAAAMLLPQTAGGADFNRFQARDESADASFSSVDPSGCVHTDIHVSGWAALWRDDPGKAYPRSSAWINIYKRDVCAHLTLMSASGLADLPDGGFSVDGGLKSAWLTATVYVYDSVSKTHFDVMVSVHWLAVGHAELSRSQRILTTPDLKAVYNQKGTGRDAVAAGTIMRGSEDLLQPAVFNWGILIKNSLFDLQIIRTD